MIFFLEIDLNNVKKITVSYKVKINIYFLQIHKWYNQFKKDYPDLWKISEGAMKEIQHFAANPPDLTHMNHPIHPIRKINK